MEIADHTNNENNSVFAQKCCIISFFRKYRFAAIFGLVFAVFLYSLMTSQQLTNTFDGLWQQNYYHAGVPEVTSGRWLLTFVDKLVMGLHADPIASIAALILFIAGFLLVLDLFEIENNFCSWLCIALFLSSTAISNTLSYRFTSLGYGLAYLLAALSVYAVIKIKKPVVAIAVSGVLLGLSMSCYQAYLAVFCIIAAFYIIFLCSKSGASEHKGDGNPIRALVRMGCSLFAGAACYVVSLSLFLGLHHVSLSDYNGAGSISLGSLLTGLPQSIFKTYRYFGAYFFMDKLKINRFAPFGVFYLLLALLLALIVVVAIRVWRVKKPRVVILLLAAAAIPVAGNAYMLIAGDKLELQMASGLAMLVPLTMMLAFSCLRGKRCLQCVCTVFCVVLLFGNSMQVWFDQEAMYEGRSACETMAARVIGDLKSDDLLSSDYEYFFVGVPAENPFFSVSDIYRCANGYAQMGNFWVSGNCSQMSYGGLINKHMGFNLPMSDLCYENIEEEMNVSEMPVFPEDGYITLLDEHVVVIKISEYQAYTGYSKYAF